MSAQTGPTSSPTGPTSSQKSAKREPFVGPNSSQWLDNFVGTCLPSGNLIVGAFLPGADLFVGAVCLAGTLCRTISAQRFYLLSLINDPINRCLRLINEFLNIVCNKDKIFIA